MISIKNLKLGYIREFYALYNINLEVSKGDKVAIVGKEDSGKTSLLRIIAKLQEPTSGEILINDIPLQKLDYSVDLSVAFITTHPIFFERKTVRQNLEYVLKIRKIEKIKLISLLEKTLNDFSLLDVANSKVNGINLYQKRLLQFAMISIRSNIDLLLIDEIFEGLNPKELNNIIEIAKTFINQKGTTTLFATPNLDLAQKLCTRIIKISLGSFEDCGDN